MSRIRVADPTSASMITVLLLSFMGLRGFVYLCTAGAIAVTVGVTPLWAVPGSVVLAQTVGRVWAWGRRNRAVAMMEKAADDAEALVASKAEG